MPKTAVLLYDILIQLYLLGIRIAAPFSPKAKRWMKGRKKLYSRLSYNIGSIHGRKIWFHCASLGEFEQARPLMEKIKRENPDNKIILTFFSPSGYDVRRHYEGADYVAYMPIDTAANARRFIGTMQPSLVIWVKYEFWYHHLSYLYSKKIPVILISSVFRKDHIFFKSYGALHRAMLGFFSHIFVQNKASKELLQTLGVASEVCSDTRFDRVVSVMGQRKSYDNIAAFKEDKKILIVGSTWTKDADLICRLVNGDPFEGAFKYIIAPHDVKVGNTNYLINHLKKPAMVFSRITTQNAHEYTVAIIDSLGMLSSLYYYGDIAYIGGGFDTSVHNILEPAVYGMPVIFGPNHQKSLEALALLAHPEWHAAYTISTYEELVAAISSLIANNDANLHIGKRTAKEYVAQNTGGTDMIYDYLVKNNLI